MSKWALSVVAVLLVVYMLFSRLSAHVENSLSFISMEVRMKEFQYVYDDFKKKNPSVTKFVSNDTSYSAVPYELKQNMMWNHHSVCTNNTFLLLMYFTYRDEYGRRELIRQYVKQGMVVDGKTLNYVIVVASDKSETDVLERLKKENDNNQDLLVSMHKDTGAYWPITVLDSFMWARDYCKEAAYVCKVDGDTWAHLGNLVHYLRNVPKTKYYGGKPSSHVYKRGQKYKGIRFIPSDYPERNWLYNIGACCVFSHDIIPYLNIGTQFLDTIFPACEDIIVGEILRKAGIYPYGKPKNYNWVAFHYQLKNMSITPDTIFVHVKKDFTYLKEFYTKYADNYTTPF